MIILMQVKFFSELNRSQHGLSMNVRDIEIDYIELISLYEKISKLKVIA